MVRCVSDIVAAYVSKNQVSLEDLPSLIKVVRENLGLRGTAFGPATIKAQSMSDLESAANNNSAGGNQRKAREPAVAIGSSVKASYICCLEDGKQFKTLRRHLNAEHGLSPEEYRARWNLPPNYPMVAAQYASRRSHLAKAIGLGRSNKKKKQKKNWAA